MKKFIPPIGESDFRNLRRAKHGFVDKSWFIREVVADSNKAIYFVYRDLFKNWLTEHYPEHGKYIAQKFAQEADFVEQHRARICARANAPRGFSQRMRRKGVLARVLQ